MILGIGFDVCSMARWQAMCLRNPRAAHRLLTPREASLSLASQAARFAAKEALAKALGSPGGLSWQDCEITPDEHGKPVFELRGTVAALAESLGIDAVHVTLSHDAGLATAMVVTEG